MKENIFETEPSKLFEFIKAILDGTIIFDKEDVRNSLLLMSLNKVDYELADKLCTNFIHDKDEDISRLSVQAIGHIARVYEKLINKDLYEYICEIYKDKKHPLCGYVEDALNDIQIFLKIPKPDDIGGVRMIKEEADGRGFTLFKDMALRLNNSINELFDEHDNPIVLTDNEVTLESDTLRITIKFEEIKK